MGITEQGKKGSAEREKDRNPNPDSAAQVLQSKRLFRAFCGPFLCHDTHEKRECRAYPMGMTIDSLSCRGAISPSWRERERERERERRGECSS